MDYAIATEFVALHNIRFQNKNLEFMIILGEGTHNLGCYEEFILRFFKYNVKRLINNLFGVKKYEIVQSCYYVNF